MAVKSIECQLVQAQMKRYLAGTDFPDELLDQLERHLKACPDCKEEANRQREALGGAPADVAQAVVSSTGKAGLLAKLMARFSSTKVSVPVGSLVQAPGRTPFAPSALDVIRTPKNMVLSLSLAAVLVAMSTVMRHPGSFFGARAAATIATAPEEGDGQTNPSEPEAHADKAPDAPEGAPEMSDDLRAETLASDAHTAESAAGHADKAASKGEPVKQPRPHKETVEHQLEKVGGDVLIADSAAPVKKPTPKTPRPKPATSKPAVRSSTGASASKKQSSKPRTPRKRSPRSVVRIYQP